MTEFEFRTDDESRHYCEEIVQEMMRLFGIPRDEAVGRMNRAWRDLDLIGEDDLIYHEDEEYWANNIYYGKDSEWWLNPSGLKPLPYPSHGEK